MNEIAVPSLPPNAPFTPEQRAWINGFLAGALGLSASTVSAPMNVSAISPAETVAPVEVEDDMPWHDATLPMDERLKMAEDKPLPLRLMAAMAQLDCGSCGYDCKTYASALAAGDESDVGKCVPGGIETKKTVKLILAAA